MMHMHNGTVCCALSISQGQACYMINSMKELSFHPVLKLQSFNAAEMFSIARYDNEIFFECRITGGQTL